MNAKTMPLLLVAAAILITGAIYWLEKAKTARPQAGKGMDVSVTSGADQTQKDRRYPRAKEIVSPAGFINAGGITVQELIGKKVIMIDFWTYSCINCQRTMPYVTAWYEKYRDQGLEIIGVHTPEFEFEKKLENVQWAVTKYGIEYPVVLDNDYGTWSAYANRYWPRKYLIDIDGYIVYDHIGEGGYEETEKKIQELLLERKNRLGEEGSVATGVVAPTDVETVNNKSRSPEIYFGASRNTYLGNGNDGVIGTQTLVEPTGVKTGILYLAGTWDFQPEYAKNTVSGAKIIFRYQGAKVYMVASAAQGISGTVLRDGKPLVDGAGRDVSDGEIKISDDRLYEIINDGDEWGEHTLEIIFSDPGATIFTFTFG